MTGPFILAMILGPMMETNFAISDHIRGDLAIFYQRPFLAFFLVIVCAISSSRCFQGKDSTKMVALTPMQR